MPPGSRNEKQKIAEAMLHWQMSYDGGEDVGAPTSTRLYCDRGSLDAKKVEGKIVSCQCGGNVRVQKGEEFRRAGGIGMLLLSEPEEGDALLADAHFITATEMKVADGLSFTSYINSTKSVAAYISTPRTVFHMKPAPIMASFSSLGPTILMPEILKPDITAPGLRILAAWSGETSPSGLSSDHRKTLFNIISDTSMACLHVAGIAALVKATYPDWRPTAISSAIMTTDVPGWKVMKKKRDMGIWEMSIIACLLVAEMKRRRLQRQCYIGK